MEEERSEELRKKDGGSVSASCHVMSSMVLLDVAHTHGFGKCHIVAASSAA
jgi:hypothetical protein